MAASKRLTGNNSGVASRTQLERGHLFPCLVAEVELPVARKK
jgi:hypothetical protein